jgi:hypothetical protein
MVTQPDFCNEKRATAHLRSSGTIWRASQLNPLRKNRHHFLDSTFSLLNPDGHLRHPSAVQAAEPGEFLPR